MNVDMKDESFSKANALLDTFNHIESDWNINDDGSLTIVEIKRKKSLQTRKWTTLSQKLPKS